MAKQHYCFLERFNNYFNRKVIRYDSLSDYQDNAQADYIPVDDEGNMTPFDFNPNDNITTEIIANGVPFDPDYFLLLDADGEIVSRWFVLEQKRNRQGQWLYFLRRDVLADSYDELATAPMYVEKGIISDIQSPLLFNNEGLTVNQIKKQEIPIYDRTKCAWLVMYIKKGVLGTTAVGSSGKVTIDVPDDDGSVYETLNVPIASWSMAQYQTSDYNVLQSNSIIVLFKNTYNSHSGQRYTIRSNGTHEYVPVVSADASNIFHVAENITKLDTAFASAFSSITGYVKTELGYKDLDDIMKYNGKVIKDSAGKYYLISVYQDGSPKSSTVYLTSGTTPLAKNAVNSAWNTANESSQSANDKAYQSKVDYISYRLAWEETTSVETIVDFSAYTGGGCQDTPLYDIIAMPYGEVRSYGSGGLIDVTSSAERSMRVMNSLARTLTDLYVFDLQLLPYCPMPELINASIDARMAIKFLHDSCLTGEYNSDYTDIIYVPTKANITFNITQAISITDSSDVPSTFKKKYVNDCTMVRLCSPNYNGVFEFNLAKNDMTIDYFNVDITMRPQNPYIHMNPNFKQAGLYYNDYDDARGLICGGDFSLGIINDAWTQYEIQNKNYQAIFDRQIQNMDVNNSINRQEALFGAIAGTAQGAGAGAVGGFMASGSPYGAIAGAVIGGVASGVGGALDISNLKKRQEEARDYAFDNYNYSLGNIKALPYSITRTSALTYNNKKVPFIEIYECTEVEKEAYYLKLKYNGMTVSKIDTIESYKSSDNSNYFRAKLIRLVNISEDNHYVETINEELMKGVFI